MRLLCVSGVWQEKGDRQGLCLDRLQRESREQKRDFEGGAAAGGLRKAIGSQGMPKARREVDVVTSRLH